MCCCPEVAVTCLGCSEPLQSLIDRLLPIDAILANVWDLLGAGGPDA